MAYILTCISLDTSIRLHDTATTCPPRRRWWGYEMITTRTDGSKVWCIAMTDRAHATVYATEEDARAALERNRAVMGPRGDEWTIEPA